MFFLRSCCWVRAVAAVPDEPDGEEDGVAEEEELVLLHILNVAAWEWSPAPDARQVCGQLMVAAIPAADIGWVQAPAAAEHAQAFAAGS